MAKVFSDVKRDEMRHLAEYLERYRMSDPHIGPDDCDLIVAALRVAIRDHVSSSEVTQK